MNEAGRYRAIGRGFDASAAAYDGEIGHNPAMQYMRSVSLETLCSTFSPGQRVLEIGCGTGAEAIALAARGVRVVATDLSEEMIGQTRAKVAAAGLAGWVEARTLAAGELGALLAEGEQGRFDGAYSSFGPLNGEPDLTAVGETLGALLRPGSRLVASVMNRFYAFEVLWYAGHGRLGQAVRRWGGMTMATVSPSLPVVVPTWYHTPGAFARAFAGWFRVVRYQALPLLLPPPYLDYLWRERAAWVARLRAWEQRLAGRWPLAALGDHFLIVMERAGAA
ncbi:MAG: class I SAM-dependent methyltransferase [Anaerolineae bacterium]|nr:class I SAM-dependent methyltransferase [Anaerolineae bacterium]